VLTALVMVATLLGSAVAAPNGKKLIEWGFDQPNTAFMRQNIVQMEATPFDGTVFDAYLNNGNSFADAYWGGYAATQADLSTSLADLQATHFTKFTDNFLRLNVTPYGPSAGIDWFDDFTSIVNNSRVAAQTAKDGGVKGLMLDTEQYTQQIWQYGLQRDAGTKTWNQYAAQARQRGSEIMQAFQQGYPDLTLFLSFGYTLPGRQTSTNPATLQNATYGLLAPFLDGMVDAATGNTTIVDGFELSYPVSVRRDGLGRIQFDADYMHSGVLPIVGADHSKYAQHVSAGMATWMDQPPFNPNLTEQILGGNWFTPSDLEATLKAKLAAVDEYAWLYSETPRWWTEAGGTQNLSAAYYNAVANAVAPVPEPSSFALLAIGGAGFLLWVRRRKIA